jgi:hypothetical protein
MRELPEIIMKLLLTFAIFAAWSLPLVAQISVLSPCHNTKATEVPASTLLGGMVTCKSGITISTTGVQISTDARQTCPLMCFATPPHQVVESTTMNTNAVADGEATVLLFHYACTHNYFLFIQLNDSCDLLNPKGDPCGTVNKYRTVSCAQPAIRI